MSTSVRSDSVGGIVKPLWTSRSRAPATGVSTVRTSAREPGRPRAADEVEAGVAVVPQVELEPSVGVRARRRRRPRATSSRASRARTGCPCRPATRATAGSPSACISRVKPVGREDQRHRRRPAEDRRRGVDLRHVLEHAWDELDPRERVARSPQARLGLGRPVDVVEHGSRDVPAGDRPEIPDGRRRGEPALDGREAGPDPCGGTAGARTGGEVARRRHGRVADHAWLGWRPRFVAPQRLGRADQRAQRLEVAVDQARALAPGPGRCRAPSPRPVRRPPGARTRPP